MSACPDATWGQVFGAVDRLSRTGRVTLQRRGRGIYIITTSSTKEDDHEHVNTVGTTRTRMNPFRELEEMEKRLSTIFGRQSLRPDGEKEALTMAEWSPLVDITEDEKEYLIKAEVPEIKKEDIKLLVQDNVLTISGERKFEKEEKGKKIIGSSEPTAAS